MAIENVDANDLILFDNTYVERISLRCSLLQQHREDVIGVTDISNTQIQTSIKELYNYLFAYYLPTRYPSIFHTYQDEKRTAITKNLITNQTFPAAADKSIPIQSALETICQNIDEDFFILLPDDPHNPEETTYTLKSYSACFPSGFKPIDKLGKKLADIHGPVPGYKAKLQKSMDRFFAKLQPGRFVKRVNWGITVDEELYSNFDKSGPAFEGKLKAMTLEELDLDKAFLRCERQTLHRLPASGAIVFAFHTYLYPIQDIRNEGLGEDLACAIEGLQRGSTPEMFTYKNGEKWADAVKEFLRI
ncbi:hypothetical protein BDV25DRAFT_168191 [Aspergillus avenaceus]|uniref:HRQ family protein 2 n=1 Tax=Aspergillus avenaceus TaxID=36643 RepID=A0A5N6TR89_ASPAV|nr:hypothetical protein BDV25DRAFT_168191 [Aspergillus avenaceus]